LGPSSGSTRPHTYLGQPWRSLARAVWIALALLYLSTTVAWVAQFARQPLPVCSVASVEPADCDPLVLSAEDAAVLSGSAIPVGVIATLLFVLNVAMSLAHVAIAALIAWRKADDWMALLASGALLALGLGFGATPGEVFSDSSWVFRVLNGLTGIFYVAPFGLLYLAPDGHFVPRWTRWFLLAVVLATALVLIPLQIQSVVDDAVSSSIIIIIFGVGGLVGAGSFVYRYRHTAGPLERQQMKWVVLGAFGSLMTLFSWATYSLLFPVEAPSPARTLALVLGVPVIFLLGTLFPVCVAVAVFRYRLWDVDLLVRRTLVYGALTGLLAGVYFGGVVVLQPFFQAFGGQQSELAIVLSTLVTAALFAPLRRRVQDFVDRRFYRGKYDAAQTLAHFAETARDEVDLDGLAGELLRVVQETMQPERVSLWLKPVAGRRSEQETR
jgi:hypothetical protein